MRDTFPITDWDTRIMNSFTDAMVLLNSSALHKNINQGFGLNQLIKLNLFYHIFFVLGPRPLPLNLTLCDHDIISSSNCPRCNIGRRRICASLSTQLSLCFKCLEAKSDGNSWGVLIDQRCTNTDLQSSE